MKPAARVGDSHSCPLTVPTMHFGGTIAGPGDPSVEIANLPAAVVGTPCTCAVALPNVISKGSTSVTIGHRPAARFGDPTAHGGTILSGCSSVLIGD